MLQDNNRSRIRKMSSEGHNGDCCSATVSRRAQLHVLLRNCALRNRAQLLQHFPLHRQRRSSQILVLHQILVLPSNKLNFVQNVLIEPVFIGLNSPYRPKCRLTTQVLFYPTRFSSSAQKAVCKDYSKLVFSKKISLQDLQAI